MPSTRRSATANEADDAPALVPLSAQPSAPDAATPKPSTSSSALEASTPSSGRPRRAAAARGFGAALDDQIDLGGSVSDTLPCAEVPPPARPRGRPPKNAARAPSPSPLAAAVAFQAAQHDEAPAASVDGASDVSGPGVETLDNAAALTDVESPKAAACPDVNPAVPTADGGADVDIDVLTAANARGLDIFKLIDFWGPDGAKGQKSHVGTRKHPSFSIFL